MTLKQEKAKRERCFCHKLKLSLQKEETDDGMPLLLLLLLPRSITVLLLKAAFRKKPTDRSSSSSYFPHRARRCQGEAFLSVLSLGGFFVWQKRGRVRVRASFFLFFSCLRFGKSLISFIVRPFTLKLFYEDDKGEGKLRWKC